MINQLIAAAVSGFMCLNCGISGGGVNGPFIIGHHSGGLPPPPSCHATTASYVQGTFTLNNSVSSSTVIATFTTAVARCDTVFLTVGYLGTGRAIACTDNAGNTYTQVGTATNTVENFSLSWFVLSGITNTPVTVTCNIGAAAQFTSLIMDDVAGLGVATLDKFAAAAQANPPVTANGVSSGFVTTTAVDFIYGSAVNILAAPAFLTTGTGFTGHQAIANEYYTETMVQTLAGSAVATWTASAANMQTIAGILAMTPH